MHIHILGICGTFMGGVAVLAQQAGFTVTGCDANVYPPMSTQLTGQGIQLIEGYDPNQIHLKADLYVIGNVVTRGNPLMEEILNRGLPYMSGPEWISKYILHDKWVLAVAGTHGKTTTSSMLAWILQDAGFAPGFLIGGVPLNFGVSARLGENLDAPSDFFVIEADEYDTAFFDKRSKFVHYHPRTVILNNLEYDHADIFADLAAIETQFHHLIRTIPNQGRIIANAHEASLERVLARGCWSELEWFGENNAKHSGWKAHATQQQNFDVHFSNQQTSRNLGSVDWHIQGLHNRLNGLAAIAAAHHVGVLPTQAIDALSRFQNVKRRMEVRGNVRDITVYDDFAHHPTAIATTIAGLRDSIGSKRILAVLEPRSNTMKLGTMKAALAGSLENADLIFAYQPTGSGAGWDVGAALEPLGTRAEAFADLAHMVQAITQVAQPGDHILIMSNGGFGNVHEKILKGLTQ